MNFRWITEPLSWRHAAALAGLGVVALGLYAGGRALVRWWDERPKSPAAVKRQIWAYLKKEAGRRDFSAASVFEPEKKVEATRRRLASLEAESAVLQTNLAQWREQSTRLAGELTRLQSQVREVERSLPRLQKLLELKRTQLANLEKKAEPLLESPQIQSQPGAGASNAAPSLATVTPESDKPARKRAARVTLAEGRLSDGAATNALAERKALRKKSSRAGWKGDPAVLLANLQSLRTNVVALEAEWVQAREKWMTLTNALAEKQAAYKAKQAQISEASSLLQERRKEVQQLSKELWAEQKNLARAPETFLKEINRKMYETVTYAQVYHLIGQLLWVAERLQESDKPEDQAAALRLAMDARSHALESGEDEWLAARICEGYILPCATAADTSGKHRRTAAGLLRTCASTFQQAGETRNVIRAYRAMLEIASDEQAQDSARYYLARALEADGQLREALRLLRQIQSTNLLPYVEKRIPALSSKLGLK